MKELDDLINGTLLGDGCIFLDRGKYARYKLTAKDKNFLIWMKLNFEEFNMKTYMGSDKRNYVGILYGSTSKRFLELRSKWYVEREGMNAQKIIPKDLELNSTVLLHWYLGDGSLNRHKNDNRVPSIVLATCCFSDEDIDLLIQKLKELNLNFYKVRYRSGFTKKECGYCLYSKIQDSTPFRFFKLIGTECPSEIRTCITGNKGRGSKTHYFKDKWPNEDEWLRIMSNVHGIGKLIRDRRIEMNLNGPELAKQICISSRFLRHVEFGDRFPSVDNFRRAVSILNLNIRDTKNR